MSGDLRVRFRGVRGSIPSPRAECMGFGGNTPCLEVRLPDDELLIIDAGSGIQQLGQEISATEPGRRIHLLFTHFHWDHIQGFPYFPPLYEADREILIRAPGDPADVERVLAGQMSAPYFPVPLEAAAARVRIEPAENSFDIGPATVHAFPLNHPQGATGYRIECGDAALVHASDFEHGDPACDAALCEAARSADLLIFDAQFTPEQYPSRIGWGHSTWAEGARIAQANNVGRLVLFHHDPMHNDDAIEELEAAACERLDGTCAAREGMTIEL